MQIHVESPINLTTWGVIGIIIVLSEIFREGARLKEEQELTILETYLPEQLNTDDLVQRIDAVIQELGATSDKDLGRVMRVVMPAVQGRADGATVNRLVRERLAGSLPG